jgi:hypothetical protein
LVEGGLAEALTEPEHAEVRALIHPEVVIQPAEGQPSLFGGANGAEDVIRVMDVRQERLAKSLGRGHRVIRGVAGSGKTVVLVARAKLLSQWYPNDRILVTCFTRALASLLRHHLEAFENVEVVHLHKLIRGVLRHAGFETSGRVDWAAQGGQALSR